MDRVHSRVLLVAADPTVRSTLEEVLREYRYEVTTERSEETVAALVGRHHINQAHPRILLVAADPTVRFTLEEVLCEYRYEVTTERSEETVAALVGRHHFDALVLVRRLLHETSSQLISAELCDNQEMWLEWIPL